MRSAQPPSRPDVHDGPLTDDDAAQVRALAKSAEETDGVAPLSEQPLLRLQTLGQGDGWTHLLTRSEGQVVAYAQVDTGGDEPSAELVVHPQQRRRGLGSALLSAAQAVSAERPAERLDQDPVSAPFRVWAHGDLPAARALAASAGLVVVRDLWVMALDLRLAPHPAPAIPAGLRLRTFVPGPDDEAWLRVNARAFAHHPEQGRMALDDLRARQAEDWFDANGFFLLERDGRPERAAALERDGAGPGLVGFLWTKVPTDQPAAGSGEPREGEIYVVGVDPSAQGEGLGGLLTAVGLAHLAAAGLDRAVLYVDGDNAAATHTYARVGFERTAVDVQFGTPPGASDPNPEREAGR